MKKTTSYRSPSLAKTLRKQHTIAEWLSVASEGLSVREIGEVLGVSRQLALYHVKKMAAAGLIVMMLEPCEGNGGLQYRVWDEQLLSERYARRAAPISDVRSLLAA